MLRFTGGGRDGREPQGVCWRVVESVAPAGVGDGRSWRSVAMRAERGTAVIFAMGCGLDTSEASLGWQRSEKRVL